MALARGTGGGRSSQVCWREPGQLGFPPTWVPPVARVPLPRDPKYQVPAEAPLRVHGKPSNIKTAQETASPCQNNLPKQVQQVTCSPTVAQGVEQRALVNLKAALSGQHPHHKSHRYN